MSDAVPPKTFISYSWTDTGHEEWVLDLARDLREYGVDVIIDKWDLEEGQDMVAFMEQMVNDPEMDKVLIICDEEYAEKADQREGGVGTETQIVSKDLYDEVNPENPQEKFAAVIAEVDAEGKPYLPTYMKNRIYFDMSTPEARADNFERLVRWLHGKPQEEKPPLGSPPTHILEQDGPSLATSSRAVQVKRKLRGGNTAAVGALRDYFETFAENLGQFKIDPEGDRPSPEEVMESIEDVLPYRDEAVDLFVTLSKYWRGQEGAEALHDFFELLLPYTVGDRPGHNHDTSVDNLAFLVRELFLYAIGGALSYKRFEGVRLLLKRPYYLNSNESRVNTEAKPFTSFRTYLVSLEDHWDHNRVNKTADILKARATRDDLAHDDVMQASLLLYLRAESDRFLDRGVSKYERWYPDVLLYANKRNRPFEIFGRAARGSTEGVKTVLDLASWEDFVSLVHQIDQERGFPKLDNRWPLKVPRLVGIQH